MKAWGQWVEDDAIFGVKFDKDFLYNFNHWELKTEWHGPNTGLLKYDNMKFYIRFEF